CQFYPPGEYLRFVRVPENLKVGEEVLRVDVHPRRNLSLRPIDKSDDVHYFTYKDLNRTTVSLLLARPLEDLVDTDNPQNVLKFRLMCDYDDDEDVISSSLSVTVYVEDINDHSPVFQEAPYHVTVEEVTPVGLTIFRGIKAGDRDKPNTPNSDVQYAITAGNERGKFALDSSHQAYLVLKKALDYDSGDREFLLTVTASDRGLPPRSTNATVKISIVDNDDLPPKFTKGVYRTKLTENYPITGAKLRKLLRFEPSIFAYDQDLAIDSRIRYDIIAGNERRLFYLDHYNGSLFLEKEIDLESEKSLPGNTFVLQIQASQVDNPLKTGVARVEVEIIDLNDNLPEFEVDIYNISIVENLPNGFSVLQIIATDQDQGDNGEFSFQLEDKSRAFSLDSKSGWLMVRDQTILDREKRATISMRVYAKEKTASVVRDKRLSFVNIEVTLLDANDNNPTFLPNNVYDFVISTDAKIGDTVGKIHAIDPDLGNNGVVNYNIQRSTNTSYYFKIDNKTGLITITHAITEGKHLLFIEASDQPLNPSERRASLAVVTIDVINHRSRESIKPSFIGAPYEFWVGENVDIGTSVGQIRVTNIDQRNPIMYDLLHSYHEGVPFAVEERTGTITVVDGIPKYERVIYDFEAVISNDKTLSLVTNVTIHIVDPKDKNIFIKGSNNFPMEFHVKENKANHFIGRLMPNSTAKAVKFFIANQRDVTDHITIASNGSLYTVQPLDRELRDVYRLTIIAEYGRGIISGTGIYQVIIYVDDENDNAPSFDRSTYEGKIKENSASGTEVDLEQLIHVKDADIGSNGQFTLSLQGTGNERFRLDRFTGKILFSGPYSLLDREDKSVYNLKIVAKDKGGLTNDSKLTIYIEDENDNSPIFTQLIVIPDLGVLVQEFDEAGNKVALFQEGNNTYILTQSYIKTRGKNRSKVSPLIIIPEDIPLGSVIMKLIATDKDFGDNAVIKYEMISETLIPHEKSTDPFHITHYFNVNPVNGDVVIARTLPPESEFRLNLTATDSGGLKDTIKVKIFVKDVNNHPPVFKKSWYTFDAKESVYSRDVLGKIEATDADFGQNANLSYKIKTLDGVNIPFKISDFSGVLSIDGELDREMRDKYSFVVVARDNPKIGKSFASAVNVDINVVDINDNSPTFYGHDDLVSTSKLETKYSNHQMITLPKIPVYYATVSENSPIGTPVTKVYANDSDFTGNGNGLILFDIPYKKNGENCFAIDSKEGVITTIAKLDYEKQKVHNVTIVASDLGSPSLTSSAILVVNVIDVAEDLKSIEHPVFSHRYYEVEVEENVPVPLKILTLNVTEPYRSHKLRYSIVAEKTSPLRRMFKIDPRNGTLYITDSPDREEGAYYELKIRLDQYKVGRDMTVMVYPVTNERLGDLGLNEVKVIVRITDTNDNVPKFTINGRPIVAAIPTTANFGFHIVRLQATDPDLGLNGEVRYQILGRADEETRRFAIDPISGQVRAVSSFARDAGKVYGFDVKATDRRGADDGKSSIANVFVYVLDEEKQLVMVMGSRPTDVERNMENITQALFNATGFDVRIRKLEPHLERNQVDSTATDMFLYAVDPKLNTVVDMNELQTVILLKQNEIENQLKGHKVLALASGAVERVRFRSQRVVLSTLEVGVVILGCVVFIGALATAICVICIRRKKKRILQKSFSQPIGFPIATLGKPALFPSSFGDALRYDDGSGGVYHSSFRRHHESSCPRYSGRRTSHGKERSRSVGALETSIASLHSSGKDSGIADGIQCQCSHSTTQSSEEGSNGYEDSLQSMSPRKLRDSFRYGSSREIRDYYNRRRSFSDDLILNAPTKPRHLYPHGHIQANLVGQGSALRKSSERLIMTCPLNP
ncbi:PREDICTED: cadherin-89D, partial [Nicrophorus vespilloides]|uniref:Cadherin-89D n=1 Tax=Nicrophorus vespilloides TaxID=110193 RepID=A0ABM1N447_NICVS